MARDQLAVVQRLAERHEKEAGIRLSTAQGALVSAESQLKQARGLLRIRILIQCGDFSGGLPHFGSQDVI